MERRRSNVARLLLLEDVVGLGRKGEVVSAKPGFARNYLLPQRKAVVAEAHTLRIQAKLQEERAKQAAIDLETSQAVATQINGITLATHVKVDHEGHMYASVSAAHIVALLKGQGFEVEQHSVRLGQAIKQIGLHMIELKLKEGVTCSFKLKVIPEGMDDLPVVEEPPPGQAEAVAEAPEETPSEASAEEEA